jgi:hypothetical protein
MLNRFITMLALVAVTLSASLLAHDELRFIGTVTKFDVKTNIVTVKYRENGKDETVDVDLTAKTELTRDKKAIARAQLRPGVHVVVDALGCEDKYEAVAIRIVPPPTAGR